MLNAYGRPILIAWLAIAAIFFTILLFGNLAYPLLWADESVTAVGAQRVLKFGYPKSHDGRNVLYDLRHSDPDLGIDAKTDAYIGGAGWAQYYYLAPFAWLAGKLQDLYGKTFMLRLPFALIGLAGVGLFLWFSLDFVPGIGRRLLFSALFISFECASIPLILHLREVRYYSLQLALTASLLILISRYHLQRKMRFSRYCALATAGLVALFFTFAPGFFILGISLTAFLILDMVLFTESDRKASLVQSFKTIMPAALALVIMFPCMQFFKTFPISAALSEFYNYSFGVYLENLTTIGKYFYTYEIFGFVIVIHCAWLAAMFGAYRKRSAIIVAWRAILLISVFIIIYF